MAILAVSVLKYSLIFVTDLLVLDRLSQLTTTVREMSWFQMPLIRVIKILSIPVSDLMSKVAGIPTAHIPVTTKPTSVGLSANLVSQRAKKYRTPKQLDNQIIKRKITIIVIYRSCFIRGEAGSSD